MLSRCHRDHAQSPPSRIIFTTKFPLLTHCRHRRRLAAAAPPSHPPFSHHPRFLRFFRCFQGMRSQIQTAIPFELHQRRAYPLQALPPLLVACPRRHSSIANVTPHAAHADSRPQAGNTPVHASFCSLCGVSADNAPVLAPPYSFIPFLVTGKFL
jgi:hypothetical protein